MHTVQTTTSIYSGDWEREMASVAVVLVIISLLHSSWEQEQHDQCNPETWQCRDSDVSSQSAASKREAGEEGTGQESNYAFLLSQEYYGDSYGSGMMDIIDVKIHLRTCPTLSSTTPHWFKLEAISSVTGERTGIFDEPFTRSEAVICNQGQSIIFRTCNPHPLDLPKTYHWMASAGNFGKICFRLTVNDRDRGCHVTEKCIDYLYPEEEYELTPTSITRTEPSPSASISIGTEPTPPPTPPTSGTQPRDEAETDTPRTESNTRHPQRVKRQSESSRCQRVNCTNATQHVFCGRDGNIYMSRCEKRLAECLTGKDIFITRSRSGECPTATTPPPTTEPPVPDTPCTRASGPSVPESIWKPVCDCQGNYKLIQCYKPPEGPIDCWCSTKASPQVLGTRSVLHCEDPSLFYFSCEPQQWF